LKTLCSMVFDLCRKGYIPRVADRILIVLHDRAVIALLLKMKILKRILSVTGLSVYILAKTKRSRSPLPNPSRKGYEPSVEHAAHPFTTSKLTLHWDLSPAREALKPHECSGVFFRIGAQVYHHRRKKEGLYRHRLQRSSQSACRALEDYSWDIQDTVEFYECFVLLRVATFCAIIFHNQGVKKILGKLWIKRKHSTPWTIMRIASNLVTYRLSLSSSLMSFT
jgi:hypothetical protein